VEDNPVDAMLVQEALKAGGFTGPRTLLDDGAPALRLLRKEDPYAGAPIPEMVILDLNLKTVDGPEVLSFIRHSSDLCKLMVVVLSSSPEDVMRLKAAEADSYITKPPGLPEFIQLGDTLRKLYLKHAA